MTPEAASNGMLSGRSVDSGHCDFRKRADSRTTDAPSGRGDPRRRHAVSARARSGRARRAREWSRRRGVLGVFAAFAVVGFAAAYIGPTGVALSRGERRRAVAGLAVRELARRRRRPSPVDARRRRGGIRRLRPRRLLRLRQAQAHADSRAGGAARRAGVRRPRGWRPPFVTPDPGHRAGDRLRDGARPRLGRRSVRLPGRAVEQGIRLARQRLQRRQRRLRHPAGAARQQDGHAPAPTGRPTPRRRSRGASATSAAATARRAARGTTRESAGWY